MALACTIVRELEELVPFERAWRDLLARSSMDVPTPTPIWLGTWWRVFGSTGARRLRTARFTDGGRLVGLVPLLSRPHVYRPAIPFRRLELLASGEPESDEICSEYIGIVAERGYEEPVTTALATALSGGALGAWDEALFPAMAGDAPMPDLLVRALRARNVAAESVASGSCSYVKLPSSWDSYVASLPSAGRYVVTRSLREFDNWARGDSEVHEVRTHADLERGMHILKTLHADRWRDGGVFQSARFSAFHDTVMRALFAENALELLWLVVRGTPIAATYNIVWNQKEYFYQSGRQLELPKAVRPGIVLHAAAIRRAIEAGRREYDFLAGRSQYKRQLATASRPLVRVRAVRAPFRDFARRAAHHGFHRASRFGSRVLAFGTRLMETTST